MTPKTEAASLGEQIKDALAFRIPLETAVIVHRLVDRIVALATSAQSAAIELAHGQARAEAKLALATSEPPAPQAVGERLPLTRKQREYLRWQLNQRNYPVNEEDFAEYVRYVEEAHNIKALKEPT